MNDSGRMASPKAHGLSDDKRGEFETISLYTPFLWCFLGVLGIASVPGLAFDFFPFADAVNHVARFHILVNAETNPHLGTYYQSLFKINTNMGLEFLYVTLFAWADPLQFLKLANVFIAFAVIAGTALLGYALHGSWRLIDLISALFIFNYAFIFGFLNFSLGAGLALVSLGAWIILRRRSWIQAALFGALVGFVLYVTHLFALGLFGLAVLCVEGQKAVTQWRHEEKLPLDRVCAVLIAFLPVTLFAAMQLVPRLLGGEAAYEAASGLRYGSLEDRLTAIVGPVLTYFTLWDFALWLAMAGLGVWLVRGKNLTFCGETRWLLIALAVLVLVMPARLMDAWGAHFRPSIFLAPVLVASLSFATNFRPGWRAIFIGVVALVAFRITGVLIHNAPVARDFAQLADVFKGLPSGGTLIGVFAGERQRGGAISAGDRRLVRFQYNHATTVATLKADIFTPSIFSRADVHNLTVTPDYRHLDTPYLHAQLRPIFCKTGEGPPEPEQFKAIRAYAYGWRHKFDYVLAIGGDGSMPCPGAPMELASTAGAFQLYRIRPSSELR